MKEGMNTLVNTRAENKKALEGAKKNGVPEKMFFPFGNFCEFYTTKSARVATEENFTIIRKIPCQTNIWLI
jgi:hypothetical protein